MEYPLPEDEKERLASLHRYRILDSEPEEPFDRIARLARDFFDVPIALVTFVDMNRQWYKACYGLDTSGTPRNESFCAHAIMRDDVLVIPDATEDSRFSDNPSVTGEPYIRFYAGAPITTREGHRLGTVCVIDREPRPELRASERTILKDLAAFAMDEIDLRQAADIVRRSVQASQDEALAAAAANQAKNQFLSRMSHELRTPLTAILGFAQLLEFTELPEQDRQAVGHIWKAGKHLLGLINDVLDLSRVESGRLMMSLEPVALRDVLSEAMELVRSQATRLNVLIGNVPAKCNVVLKADKQRLKQVLVNILSNAVKYNRDGGLVTFNCRSDERSVRLEVIDTGVGIAEDAWERLFVPFERLGAERTAVEGVGLGLALSKQLAEAMNGELGLEPNPAGGTIAWIALPRARQLLVGNSDVPLTGDREVRGAPGRPNIVLYIEDNERNVKLVESVLAYRTDIELIVATDGRSGLQTAVERRPDVLLLDLHLPEMSGEEVLYAIRQDSSLKSMPVAVLSADATPQQVRHLIEVGATAYITKPFDVHELRAKVDELLRL